jgi:hypothetical protein
MLTDAPPRKASHHAGFLESDRIKTLDLPQDGRLLTIAQSVESAVKAGTTANLKDVTLDSGPVSASTGR